MLILLLQTKTKYLTNLQELRVSQNSQKVWRMVSTSDVVDLAPCFVFRERRELAQQLCSLLAEVRLPASADFRSVFHMRRTVTPLSAHHYLEVST